MRRFHFPRHRRRETALMLLALVLVLAIPPGTLGALIATPFALLFPGWLCARHAARREAVPGGHALDWRCWDKHNGDGSWR